MDKKLQIETAARALADEKGLINITRQELCDKVGISDGSFYDIMDQSFTDFINGLTGAPIGDNVDRKRAAPTLRRKQVLEAALSVAKANGYQTVKRDDVAKSANVSPGLISHYFENTEQLRICILKTAILNGVPEIVAQGLACGDPIAIQAPRELKDKALQFIAGL